MKTKHIQNSWLIKTKWFLLILFITVCKLIWAQNKDGVNAGEVNVVQEYKPTLGDAVRLAPVPEINDSVPVILPQQYSVLPKLIISEIKPEPLVPAKMKGEALDQIYPVYVRLGAGNYWNTLAEVNVGSLRSKKYQYAFQASHFSSSGKLKDYGYQGFADNILKGNGNFFVPDYIVKLDGSYKNNSFQYYGFDKNYLAAKPEVEKANTRQIFNEVNFTAQLLSNKTKKEGIMPHILLGYQYFGDKAGFYEQHFSFGKSAGKYFGNEFYGLRFEADYYNHTNTFYAKNGTILEINPFVKSESKKWKVKLGINVFVQTDDHKTFFLPDIEGSYSLVDQIIIVYGKAGSSASRTSYSYLANQNPFVSSAVNFNTTTQKLDAEAGFRGNISSALGFDAHMQYKIHDSLPLFLNQPLINDSLQNNFNVVYDNVNELGFGGSLVYNPSKKLEVRASVLYRLYTSDKQQKAWQLPGATGSISAQYYLGDKFDLRADVFYIGSRPVSIKDSVFIQQNQIQYTESIRTLKGYLDASLSLQYHYNQKFSAFLKLNNLAAQKYYVWNNYMAQRFNFLLGLTATF